MTTGLFNVVEDRRKLAINVFISNFKWFASWRFSVWIKLIQVIIRLDSDGYSWAQVCGLCLADESPPDGRSPLTLVGRNSDDDELKFQM